MQASVVETAGNIVQDPISAVLVGMGALLIGATVAIMGYLSLGAAVELISPS